MRVFNKLFDEMVFAAPILVASTPRWLRPVAKTIALAILIVMMKLHGWLND